MRIAYTGWTWLVNHKDNYVWEFEQFLREVSDLGYEEVENFAFIMDYFEGDAGRVKALLDKYNLKMANLYSTIRTMTSWTTRTQSSLSPS
jgi:inosose dehydratase